MMTFILNRTDDWVTMPKKRILAKAIVWYFAFLLINFVMIMGVTIIYNSMGVEPNQLTRFAGDYHRFLDRPLYYITMAILIAPIVEESIFRLGLSFKRQTVALWLGLLPAAIAGYLLDYAENWILMASMILIGLVLYWLVMRYTCDEQWARWRSRYLLPAIWISAIAFCLMHLRFTVLTWFLLPYCLAVVLRPGLVGCILTYVRVNLGFWWGVLFHAANNLSGAILLLLALNGQ